MVATGKQYSIDDFFLRLKREGETDKRGGLPENFLRAEQRGYYGVSNETVEIRPSSYMDIEPPGFFDKASSYGRTSNYIIPVKHIMVTGAHSKDGPSLCIKTPFHYGDRGNAKHIAFFVNNVSIGVAEAVEKAISQALEDFPYSNIFASLYAQKKQNHGSKSGDYPFSMSSSYSLANLSFYITENTVGNENKVLAHKLHVLAR